MDSFFKEVAAIKGQMADIRRNQGRLQEAHERSKMVTRSEEMKKLREQMQVSVVVQECVQLHFHWVGASARLSATVAACLAAVAGMIHELP
jgi:bifunctional ADP-heptose synthase (sugar kinase/adenylyltransferase)